MLPAIILHTQVHCCVAFFVPDPSPQFEPRVTSNIHSQRVFNDVVKDEGQLDLEKKNSLVKDPLERR